MAHTTRDTDPELFIERYLRVLGYSDDVTTLCTRDTVERRPTTVTRAPRNGQDHTQYGQPCTPIVHVTSYK
ncbi:hypothetical protein ACF98D_003764 [Escherichia coli]|nr:hypothetical protein [Escherichia coli]EJW5741677.1 hypothetical protein [Escherichia coli]MBB8113578.1 hypothetical protein [Escherichia coli]